MTSFSLTTAVELFATALLLVSSCSHVIAPRAWAGLFQDAFRHPAGALVIGFITLMVGLPILIVHWRWTGDLRSIVTLLGWAATLKGTFYLLRPATAQRLAMRNGLQPSGFVTAGVVGIVLSVLALIGTIRAWA